MQDQVSATPAPKRVPWNKGDLTLLCMGLFSIFWLGAGHDDLL